MAEEFADIEGALRQWLRVHPDKPAQLGTAPVRIWLGGMPTNAQLPSAVLRMIDEPQDIGVVVNPLIQIDVWSTSRAEADTISRQLMTIISRIQGVALRVDAHGYGVYSVTRRWLPDPDTDTPRYIVEFYITARPA